MSTQAEKQPDSGMLSMLQGLSDASEHIGLLERTREVLERLSHYQVLVCNPNRTFGHLLITQLSALTRQGPAQQLLGVAHSSDEGRSLIGRVTGRLLVITTVSLSDGPVHDWLRELAQRPTPTDVLVVMDSAHRTTVQSVLEAGANAVAVQANIGQGALLQALQAMEQGDRYIDGDCRAALADQSTASDELSVREVEILQLVAEGLSNKEIAQQLVIADVTARDHVQKILRKLGVDNRTAAVLAGVRQGYLHWTNT
ncbi:response regulator transcription factor [Synechococcus sp. RSCCF101]|uniref:response regulator transcription factor n=1 Tax=Synechococcus sp. RSCCF101 TaxID=2511069 RepID=UPI0012481336|nr:response regulator transcription factor [Synechococcus sp. RSCCF101]QEY31563.1 response regulator transcription factor [Synechococcus sp. RSCCF101]